MYFEATDKSPCNTGGRRGRWKKNIKVLGKRESNRKMNQGTPIISQGNWGLERLINSPKVTELTRCR